MTATGAAADSAKKEWALQAAHGSDISYVPLVSFYLGRAWTNNPLSFIPQLQLALNQVLPKQGRRCFLISLCPSAFWGKSLPFADFWNLKERTCVSSSKKQAMVLNITESFENRGVEKKNKTSSKSYNHRKKLCALQVS